MSHSALHTHSRKARAGEARTAWRMASMRFSSAFHSSTSSQVCQALVDSRSKSGSSSPSTSTILLCTSSKAPFQSGSPNTTPHQGVTISFMAPARARQPDQPLNLFPASPSTSSQHEPFENAVTRLNSLKKFQKRGPDCCLDKAWVRPDSKLETFSTKGWFTVDLCADAFEAQAAR